MTSTERIKKMLNGEKIDRPAVTAWKHFYFEDRHPIDFIKKTAAFQDTNDWDFIKICYNGVYFPEAHGADIQWSRTESEFPITLKSVINNPKEWLSLQIIDIKNNEVFKREIEATKKIVEKYKGKVPVIATVFSPLTNAQEMSCGWQNPWPMVATIRNHPEELHKGLETITATTLKLLDELVEAGVDGLFFATHYATTNYLTVEEYEEFGKKYDLQVLNHIKDRTWFNVLHIHGTEGLMMKELDDYPVQAINWEDIRSDISLKDAKDITKKLLICGIEQIEDFNTSDRDKIKDTMKMRVENILNTVEKERVIVAPGCVYLPDMPEYRLNALKEVIDEFEA